jgi:hypothetical protein
MPVKSSLKTQFWLTKYTLPVASTANPMGIADTPGAPIDAFTAAIGV